MHIGLINKLSIPELPMLASGAAEESRGIFKISATSNMTKVMAHQYYFIGGTELPPICGHLGGGEPMMKPHFTKCSLLLIKEVIAFGKKEFNSTIASQS